MSKLEQLPQVSEYVLNGLRADDQLKNRIYQKASQADAGHFRTVPQRRTLIALCSLSVVMIAVFAIIASLTSDRLLPESPAAVQMQTVSAGEHRSESPIRLQDIIHETVQNYEDELAEEEETYTEANEGGENPDTAPDNSDY